MNHSTIPPVGFGLWKVNQEICADVVYEAIKAGYRHLDCASDYGNEKEVGAGIQRALQEGICTREELWITSKLWNTYHAKEHVQPALERTLQDLQLDYLDLYLIHFPIALAFVPFEKRYPAEWLYDPAAKQPAMKLEKVSLMETWQAMEAMAKAGLTRQIGVCNYNTGLMQDLLAYAQIKPAMLQVELHPHLTQPNLLKFCQQHAIPVTGFSPFGALSYMELGMAGEADSLLNQVAVVEASKRTDKTPGQVLLRWGIQRGYAVIPKTIKPERMLENLAVLDFELTEEEMAKISSLNLNNRYNDPGVFCELAFNTYHPIYD